MSDVHTLLAKNIKHYRKIMNISQLVLAEKVGCSPTLIGKIESMKRFPSADTLNRIATALKVDPADLFTKSGESEAIKAIETQEKRKDELKKEVLRAIDEAF